MVRRSISSNSTSPAAAFDRRDIHAPYRYAREVLAEQFGYRAIRNLSAVHAPSGGTIPGRVLPGPWSRRGFTPFATS